MKRHGNIFALLLPLLFLLVSAGRAEGILMQVLEPEEKSVHTEDAIAFVIRIDPESFDTIKIVTDKNERFSITPEVKRATYCQVIPLHPGTNKIRIWVYMEGKKVAKVIRNIYYNAALSKEEKYPPGGYMRTFFHTDEKERLCSGCHDMSVNEKKDIAFIDVTESNCYLCHKSITAKEQTHAPAVNWLCISCHSSAAKDANTTVRSKFLAPEPIMETCLDCHKKTRELWKDKTFQHDPAAFGNCIRCHNPHASENRVTLRKPVWNLCRTCHSAKPSRQAYIKKFEELPDHPLNPKITGKELTCASCHNPHVSDREFFLQPDYSGDRSICQWEGQ